MKKNLSTVLMLLMALSFSGGLVFASVTPPPKGGTLPAFTLQIPKDPAEKAYLGLSGDGFFKIPQIKAKVVVIEIFSLY
ncbi:MAG: hypothetical protein EHM36_09325 [Deltaproteobacteria bacterium]|nr:MAG: hypothetical protein EHM36_09325 [Deltaproteobacteria bacterium]